MRNSDLEKIYAIKRVVVTAHRGFSGRFPENTLMAFQKAVDKGADIIEFDIRASRDIVPVILHDPTLDRTADAEGAVGNYTLDELKKFNFSFWTGSHDMGRRLSSPAFSKMEIPAFDEVLELFSDRICMNIQLYDSTEPLLSKVCALYKKYGLYRTAYLTVGSYCEAEKILGIDKRIQLCVLDRQGSMTLETLRELKAFGCKYVQPFRNDVTCEFCEMLKEYSLHANMFFSDTEDDNIKYVSMGLQGILTNFPDVILRQIKMGEL